MTPLVPIFLSFCRNIVAHWKIEVFIASIVAWIGLISNPFSAPKVLAVMVFLTDWTNLWTWEWWSRTIFYFVIGTLVWLVQKMKFRKRFAMQEVAWRQRVDDLERRLGHSELLLAAAQTRIEILSRK